MKILHVVNRLWNYGTGITNVAVDLAYFQSQLGHEVAVLSSGGDYETLLRKQGVQMFVHPLGRKNFLSWSLLKFSYRQMKEFRPEVVHCHTRAALFLMLTMRPFFRFKLFAQIHNSFEWLSWFMCLAPEVIFVAQASQRRYRFSRLLGRRHHVLHPYTFGSPRNVEFSTEAVTILERPNVLTVCGIYRHKGVYDLLAAFAATLRAQPEGHLYFVGEGPESRRLQARVNALGLQSRVHLLGFRKNPQALLQQTDIFVLASRQESFGLVLHEARRWGICTVSAAVGGTPEAMDFGSAGPLYPSGDVPALEGILTELLGDEAQRLDWAQRARENLDQATAEAMAQRCLEIYRA